MSPVCAEESGPNLILQPTTHMGRTLCYEIFSDQPIPRKTKMGICLAQDMLNHHFTWTCEQLSLELFDEPISPGQREEFIYFSDSKDPRPRIGTGFTKVGCDEWNACLVAAFLRWVSIQLPETTIALRDEGDYVLGGYVLFRQGKLELDRTRIARHREFLLKERPAQMLKAYDRRIKQAGGSVSFNSYLALDYADRREIVALRLSNEELSRLTLEEVAERSVFPWDSEWLEAA